jgi:hypothetical protein
VVYVKDSKGKSFVPAQNFDRQQVAFRKHKKAVFVELLTSGRTWLMKYRYTTPTGFGANGLVGGTEALYLVRLEGSSEINTLPPYTLLNKGNSLRKALKAYISDRTDLLYVVESKNFEETDLPALFRAINSGQTYTN